VFGRRKSRRFEVEANTRTVRMSVWFAALLLARLSSGFQRGLKPWFGTTVLFSVVGVVTVTDFTFTALGVFAETVVRIATVDVALFATRLTLDVAFLATRLTLDVALFATGLTLDVALFATGLTLDVAFFTAGFFATGFFATGFFATGLFATGFLTPGF
jgi:hypothetical protein